MIRSHAGRQPVTEMLQAWTAGEIEAGDRVVQLLYDELKRIAVREFRCERPDHTLQPTALVHEAYLRLREVHGIVWESRDRFFGFAAHLMRRILVEQARRRAAVKRGGDRSRVTLDEAALGGLGRAPDVLAVDEALSALAELDRRKARVVELRFFGGLTIRETAAVLNLSPETVGREWRRAKAWLYQELSNRGEPGLASAS